LLATKNQKRDLRRRKSVTVAIKEEVSKGDLGPRNRAFWGPGGREVKGASAAVRTGSTKGSQETRAGVKQQDHRTGQPSRGVPNEKKQADA